MSAQTPTNNDRSRTYWIPTMERYFIDLMLEQIHRGTRIGHTFNKQAWTDMLAAFNAKFGCQYDKDVLKSRYTALWKQFNDVKNILCQNGFSWDETQQMLVADDHLWNAYLKVHPDARSYKSKAVLNFNDLCIIYGYSTADGRYSWSSHDLDFDDEIQGANLGDEVGSLVPLNNERPRTEWNVSMDQFFVELMLDQIGRGNMVDNAFNKQAWTDMLTLFRVKFSPHHGKRVLRHRYNKLLKYYSDLKDLLKLEGFSWDETQQMVVADDSLWDAYIKTHPHARAYRMKILPNYKDLALIFGNATDNGAHSNLNQDKGFEAGISGISDGEGNLSQPFATSDRTRTYWTPPMDRYFIDLLLDQVHGGNKVGQTFITQAWSEMVASFNVKFQSHYDKDVLKNRYKHLRRLYNDIKNILEKSGFSWDETREMITAEDHVWDAYTKAHPDARSYRVKTVPSYQKLHVIFGQENSDARYSRLAQSVGLSGETPFLITAGESGADTFRMDWRSESSRAEWQPAMDRYFIDLMLEQVHEGTMINNSFREQAWAYMAQSLNEKFGLMCDKHILEDRYTTLMIEYDDINVLLSHSGFAWDATLQMITADDAIWEAYIKEHPDAIAYRNKIFESYTYLCQIQSSAQRRDMQTNRNALELETYVIHENEHFSVEDSQISDEQRKRPAIASSDSQWDNKMLKVSEELQRPVSEMTDAITTIENGKERKNHETLEIAISALQAIPDIDDELLLDACDLLEDEKKAKTFLALDAALRKKWLLRKLRSQEPS